MKNYVETPAAELKTGMTILKNHGFSFVLESILPITDSLLLLKYKNSYGKEVTEYVNVDQMIMVTEEFLANTKINNE
tara:strand:+ start:611 stop:841 length:231 start_codon:yes stop_codon:yes gene_type:complete